MFKIDEVEINSKGDNASVLLIFMNKDLKSAPTSV